MPRANKHFSSYVLSLASVGFSLWLILASAQSAQASALSDLAASMAPGTWAELTTNNIAVLNQSGTDGNIIPYGADAAWDPNSRKLLYVGNDHIDSVVSQANRFVIYNADNNTWQNMSPPPWSTPGVTDHGYYHHGVDPATGMIYRRGGKSSTVFHKYNVTSNTWTALPAHSLIASSSACCAGVDYFPELGGLVLVQGGDVGGGKVLLFRNSTQQWSTIAQNLAPMTGGTFTLGVYNPVHKVMVFGQSGAFYKMDSSGNVTRLANSPLSFYDGGGFLGNLTVDPVSGKYIFLTTTGRQLYAYDVAADTWQSQGSVNMPNLSNNSVISTPVSNYGVIMFVACQAVNCRVYLYKHFSSITPSPPTAPTVSISANPSSVVSGSASTLTWNSTNATSCTASSGWSGTKAVSGSQSTGNLTANTTFTLTCTGSGGSTSQSATVTVAASATPPSIGDSTLLVKFGKDSTLNSFGLPGWSAVIKDTYTDHRDIGPAGMTIVVGDNHTYNYQGVTGTNRSFVSGERIKVTWYNNSASGASFTPNISFTDPDRIGSGSTGTWYQMTSVTVPSFGSATSEYTFASSTVGSYSLVNVNVNYINNQAIIADRIELLPVGSSSPSFDFSLSNGGNKSATQGQSVSNNIAATLVSGTSQAVTFSISGLPSGAAATSTVTSCTPTCSTNIAIATSNSTSAGSYPITVTATGGGRTETTNFTLTIIGTTVPPPTVGTDFQTRCSAPGVIRCVGFDQPSDIVGTWGDNSGILPGNSTPVLDSTVKASGDSSIKFTIPSNSGANSSGSYFTNFSDNLSTQFGPNSEFYLQWRQRFSPEFLNTVYQGGGGWKQSIISTGDKPGCTASQSASGLCYSSCTALETVTQNTNHRGFAQLYNSCTGSASHGPYDPFQEPFGSFDFKLQNARPAPYCLYSQSGSNRFPPNGNCFGYFPDEWMTFQVHIKTGPRVNDEFTNSFVQLWIARDGQPSELAFNWGPYNLSAGSALENQRFGKIWLLPYNTGKSSAQSHPTAYTWYDELIISTSKIADPSTGGGTSTNPPAAPTALIVQ